MKKRVFSGVAAVMMLFTSALSLGAAPAVEEEEKYCGSGGYVEKSETISYARKDSSDEGHIKYQVPNYTVSANKTSCASTAGAILIGYYDRFYEELVPNYTTYYTLGTAIVYKGLSFETQAVNDELYDLMETDVGGAGTTFNGFQKGMQKYVSNHGYTYTTASIGTIDFEKYKQSINSGKPVALFLENFTFWWDVKTKEGSETLITRYTGVPHVAIGCGYLVETYYNANNQQIAQRTYLKVASGLFEYGISYLCLDGKSKIVQAISVSIA